MQDKSLLKNIFKKDLTGGIFRVYGLSVYYM